MLRIVKCSLIATAVVGMKVNRRRLGADKDGPLLQAVKALPAAKDNTKCQTAAKDCDAFVTENGNKDAKVEAKKAAATKCDKACKDAEKETDAWKEAKASLEATCKTADEVAKAKDAGKDPSCCGGKKEGGR